MQVVLGCVSFLGAYCVLQLLHAAGRDLRAVTALSPIPLFARFFASAACAVVVGGLGGLVVGVVDPRPSARALPGILAASIVVFTATALLWP
jgi:hypothetical protein